MSKAEPPHEEIFAVAWRGCDASWRDQIGQLVAARSIRGGGHSVLPGRFYTPTHLLCVPVTKDAHPPPKAHLWSSHFFGRVVMVNVINVHLCRAVPLQREMEWTSGSRTEPVTGRSFLFMAVAGPMILSLTFRWNWILIGNRGRNMGFCLIGHTPFTGSRGKSEQRRLHWDEGR